VKHNKNIRVYYEDTDAGGIVYHANYLNFAERARTEFLRDIGFENSMLRDNEGIIFVARHLDIDYLKTAKLDDYLQMQTTISKLKNSSFIMHQCTFRGDELIADMHIVMVCVSADSYRPVRLPKNIKDAFLLYMEED